MGVGRKAASEFSGAAFVILFGERVFALPYRGQRVTRASAAENSVDLSVLRSGEPRVLWAVPVMWSVGLDGREDCRVIGRDGS